MIFCPEGTFGACTHEPGVFNPWHFLVPCRDGLKVGSKDVYGEQNDYYQFGHVRRKR